MVYTKEDFKRLWEANEHGSGITFDDIAECARAWGISSSPRTRPIDEIRYKVLIAAQVNDAEEYNPNPVEERIMIDLDKAVEWLEYHLTFDVLVFDYEVSVGSMVEDFKKAMRGGN